MVRCKAYFDISNRLGVRQTDRRTDILVAVSNHVAQSKKPIKKHMKHHGRKAKPVHSKAAAAFNLGCR